MGGHAAGPEEQGRGVAGAGSLWELRRQILPALWPQGRLLEAAYLES